MKEEKSTLEAILDTLGQIIGVLLIWFIIGAAWNGIHDWFCKNVLSKTPGERSGEMFGKMAFYSWAISFIAVLYTIAKVDTEVGTQIMMYFIKFNLYFAIITLFGLIYFFKNLTR